MVIVSSVKANSWHLGERRAEQEAWLWVGLTAPLAPWAHVRESVSVYPCHRPWSMGLCPWVRGSVSVCPCARVRVSVSTGHGLWVRCWCCALCLEDVAFRYATPGVGTRLLGGPWLWNQ